MAEFKVYMDRSKDPALNDDSQPSVTSPDQVLKQAAENAGVPASAAVVPAPADAVDLAVRTKRADVDAAGVADEVVAAENAGVEADVQALGEGTEDTGSGPFENRTLPQLKAAARAKGLPVSGTHDELVERLRG